MPNANISYVAHFEADPPPPPPIQVALTVTTVGGGTTTGSPSGPYDVGTQITVTAVADPGYKFLYWSINAGGSQSSAATQIFTIKKDLSLEAFFEALPPPPVEEKVVNLHDAIGGTVTGRSGTYELGDAYNYKATPNAGYIFSGWTISSEGGEPVTLPAMFNPLIDTVTDLSPAVMDITPIFEPVSQPPPTDTNGPATGGGKGGKKPTPTVNIGSKGTDDAAFYAGGSVGVIKGLSSEAVEFVYWKMGKHKGKAKVGANGKWVLKVRGLEPGLNQVLIYGVDRDTRKRSGMHKAVIIRR